MGFYLRRSVRVGPFRFNLSTSGIGVSVGVPGLRVGMGPRGNYVHAGRQGFYYRATLPSSPRRTAQRQIQPAQRFHQTWQEAATLGVEREIESGGVGDMWDETSASLLSELDEKKRRIRVGPVILVASCLALVAAYFKLSAHDQIIFGVAALTFTLLAYFVDQLRKTTVIMYDFDEHALTSYERLWSAVNSVGVAERLWHIPTTADVLNKKYHAGASEVITRVPTSVRSRPMPYVRCNIEVASIAVGRQTLYFLPDRLLVFEAESVGAISYASLGVSRSTTRFIESDRVPGDSNVVGRTWRYVNKRGGPDRRFRDNREIPICEYEEIHFTSRTGLNELLQASQVGAAKDLVRHISSEHHAASRRPTRSDARAT